MLSILIFLPLAGGVLATLMPNADEDGGQRAGLVSLLASAGALGLAIALLAGFDTGAGLQHVTDFTWISELASTTRSGSTGSTCS